MVRHWKKFELLLLPALATAALFAAEPEHATLIREEALSASAGANAQKTGQVGRGSVLTILERSTADGQPWVKISMAADQQAQVSREVTGWLPAKTVVSSATANGDEIIFGQAVDSERQAEERGGRKGAAEDALRLYSRVAELFPGSPLAAEAMWRSADIRWQLEKNDTAHIASQDLGPGERKLIDEKSMQEVIKKFPNTKWADLAAYDLIDNKVCGS